MLNKQINYFWFFLLAAFWSGSFVSIKEVLKTVPPFFGAALRVGLGLFFIKIILVCLKKNVAVPFFIRWRIWIMGLFSQGIPFFFLFWGEQHISSGLASIINASVPVWTLLFSLAAASGTKNFSPLKAIGLFTGLLGICIILWPSVYINNSYSYLLGTISVSLMAMSYAIGNLLNKNKLSGETKLDFYANIYHQLCASLVFLMIASFCFESLPSKTSLLHTPSFWIASIYMGLFSTALAWIIYYHLIREWDAVRASAVLYVVPILAILWDFIFFHNRLKWAEGLGTIMILLAVVLIQLPPKKTFKKNLKFKSLL